MSSSKLREIICGRPQILIYRGKIDEKALIKERITINELQERLRVDNIFSIEDVEYAILETNGDLSVIQKPNKRNLTPEDMKLETNKQIVETVYKNYEETNNIVDNILDLFIENQPAVNKITEIMADQYEQQLDKKTIDNIINVYEKEKLTILKSEIIQKLNNTKDIEEIKKLEEELQNIIIKLAKIK